MPYFEPSRPSPDCFPPPKRGHFGQYQACIDAGLQRFSYPPETGNVTAIEIRRQTKLTVVCHSNNIRFVLKSKQRANWANGFSISMARIVAQSSDRTICAKWPRGLSPSKRPILSWLQKLHQSQQMCQHAWPLTIQIYADFSTRARDCRISFLNT